MSDKRAKGRTRDAAGSAVDDRQLVEAIMMSLVQYRAACRLFNARVRAKGFDRVCSKLLDQIRLRKSLLNLLAAEARQGRIAAA